MFAFLRKNGRAFLVTLGALLWALMPFAAFSQQRLQLQETAFAASMENGFARLVFTFPEEIKAETQLSNNVLVIRFAKPVRVSLGGMQTQFKELVQAARVDPDGSAVRLAFSQKITVNVMEAGEKLFVDLLPESWVGLPPGLPQEVVDDLARRARDAERRMRTEQPPPKVWQPVQVRFGDAPGFARYAFTMSEPIPVTATQDGQELKIAFNAPVKVDFGDTRASLPATVASLDVDYSDGIAVVRLVVAPNAAVRYFREASAIIADIVPGKPVVPEQLQGELQQQTPRTEVRVEKPAPEEKPAAPQNRATADDVKPQTAQPAPAPAPRSGDVQASVILARNGVQIVFPFEEAVAAAIFRRGDRIWMVFDTERTINISELIADRTRSFSDVSVSDSGNGKVVRLKLRGGWLTSTESDGQNWTVHFGDAVTGVSRPLVVHRAADIEGTAVVVPLEGAAKGHVHRIDDPEVGDDIRVVTAPAPVRGILRTQSFLEFRLLPSAHGLALESVADDLSVETKDDQILIGRPKGLALSVAQRVPVARNERQNQSPLDAAQWEAERNRRFHERETEILISAVEAPANQRQEARMTLARFYLAHDLATEAKGALDVIVREDAKAPVSARFYLLRGLSELMIGRPAKALDSLHHSELSTSQDAALLRSAAYADLSAWSEAREHFRAGSVALKMLPIHLQRRVLLAALRAAVEVRDFTEAGRLLNELDATEVPDDMKSEYAVLAGRISEGLGRADRAVSFFNAAAQSGEGAAAAEARYKLIELKLVRGEFDRPKAIEQLEALSFSWRGDRIEFESNRLLARLYVQEARYREAFRLLDAALLAQPNLPVTRTLQNELAVVFEDLFLSGKADALPPIEALALYYDFSKLTPIGRHGDELIRRLSERLVGMDLLDQASELLEHQVQFRLTGAAKAQVATRLAIVHLMNRKPQKAVAILAATRLADLPQDLREQRLLLESRALMGTNRFDNAIDLIASLTGVEAERQRSDVYWAAKRWRQAGEAGERMLGERWKEDEVLNELERNDLLRAGLAYALAGETLGLMRLKERYAEKMAQAPERAAFEQIVENPGPRAIAAATKFLSNVDSLAVFLKMYQAKFPTAQMPYAQPERLSAR